MLGGELKLAHFSLFRTDASSPAQLRRHTIRLRAEMVTYSALCASYACKLQSHESHHTLRHTFVHGGANLPQLNVSDWKSNVLYF